MLKIVKSAGRIFDVLEHFEELQRPLTLKAICARFRWPPSSASGILKSLVLRGYLDYDRFTRTYMPTMRLAQLGGWVQDVLFGDGAVLRFMQELQAATGETVSLGVQSDAYAQHIHVLHSPQPPAASLRPGSLRSLARSGLGILLLSVRDDATIDLLVRRANAQETDRRARVGLPGVLERVNEVRARGYVYARHTIVPGAALIGKLLPGVHHGRIMAVNVIGPSDRLERQGERILRRLHQGIMTLTAAPH